MCLLGKKKYHSIYSAKKWGNPPSVWLPCSVGSGTNRLPGACCLSQGENGQETLRPGSQQASAPSRQCPTREGVREGGWGDVSPSKRTSKKINGTNFKRSCWASGEVRLLGYSQGSEASIICLTSMPPLLWNHQMLPGITPRSPPHS